jgi:hypothetical protein
MDPIDLASALTGLKAAETTSRVQYAVAAKMLKIANTQGEAVTQLLEAAAEGFDEALADAIRAVAPSRALDTYA